jgi:hypothetical protein
MAQRSIIMSYSTQFFSILLHFVSHSEIMESACVSLLSPFPDIISTCITHATGQEIRNHLKLLLSLLHIGKLDVVADDGRQVYVTLGDGAVFGEVRHTKYKDWQRRGICMSSLYPR